MDVGGAGPWATGSVAAAGEGTGSQMEQSLPYRALQAQKNQWDSRQKARLSGLIVSLNTKKRTHCGMEGTCLAHMKS